jgi:predicted nucleic acid-binding protein
MPKPPRLHLLIFAHWTCIVTHMSRSWIASGSCGKNVTAYDAVYVALAEVPECVLLTGDARLSRAPGVACEVEVVQSAHG